MAWIYIGVHLHQLARWVYKRRSTCALGPLTWTADSEKGTEGGGSPCDKIGKGAADGDVPPSRPARYEKCGYVSVWSRHRLLRTEAIAPDGDAGDYSVYGGIGRWLNDSVEMYGNGKVGVRRKQ